MNAKSRNSSGGSSCRACTFSTTQGNRYLLRTVSIDELIGRGPIPVPELVKLDVEGAESRVLESACALLREKKTVLQIALRGWERMRSCLALLQNACYEVMEPNGRLISSENGLRVDEKMAVPAESGQPSLHQ